MLKYNNNIVGHLVDIDNNRIAFQYENDWLKTGFSISPFSLPLTNQIYINSKDTFEGLYGVLMIHYQMAGGALLTKRMLAKKGINYNKLSPLTKLTLISERVRSINLRATLKRY